MLRATVSGSFRRHMPAIYEAVTELVDLGVEVLSPADPRPVDQRGDFIFVASDRVRSVRMVQDRHLEAIRSSNFLWLVSPDGYVGQSASMEVGFAAACGTLILCDHAPTDITLRNYVHCVADLRSAVAMQRELAQTTRPPKSLLLDPVGAIDLAYAGLERLRTLFGAPAHRIDDRAGIEILHTRNGVSRLLAP